MASKSTLRRYINALSTLAATAATLGIGTLLLLAPFASSRVHAQTAADSASNNTSTNTNNTSDTPLAGAAAPVIEAYLRNQTAGIAGEVRIRLMQPQSGPLPVCDQAPEAFLPAGTKAWGRVSVGVRCNSAQPWTRYVAAQVAVHGPYFVAARAIGAGQMLTATDAERREGDLTALPATVVVDVAQLEGTLAANPLAMGAPLRRDLLRHPSLVRQGQAVKLVQRGQGFVTSAEGKALTSAAVGTTVQVRMQGGQVLSGVVQADGTVARGS